MIDTSDREIVTTRLVDAPRERLVYDHITGPTFRATATFADEGGKTRVTLRMVVESAEKRERVEREFGAVEGAQQTFAKMAEHLSKQSPTPRGGR